MHPGLLDRLSPPPAQTTADLTETAADDWVTRIQAGDSRAFEALYLALYPPLCAFVTTIIGNPTASEDIVQDLLFRIWERRATWGATSGGVRRYLFGAARNRALNYLKRRRVEARATDVLPVGDMGPPPDTQAEAADFSSALSRALANLPPRCREACVLRWRFGLAYPEIAEAMHVTQKAVEALLTRGLKSLRSTLTAFEM
jgi:RNA polymerase sigma-70 factor (ECF subfamily)